jgi:hypothetical protein
MTSNSESLTCETDLQKRLDKARPRLRDAQQEPAGGDLCADCGHDQNQHAFGRGSCYAMVSGYNPEMQMAWSGHCGCTAFRPAARTEAQERENLAAENARLREALETIKDCKVITDCGIDPLRSAGLRQAFGITADIARAALEQK